MLSSQIEHDAGLGLSVGGPCINVARGFAMASEEEFDPEKASADVKITARRGMGFVLVTP